LPALGAQLLKLCADEDPQVQLQCAYTLGEWSDARAGAGLATLAMRWPDDIWMRAAVLSSTNRENLGEVLASIFASAKAQDAEFTPPGPLVEQLVRLAIVWKSETALASAVDRVTAPRDGKFDPWQIAAAAGLLEALARQRTGIEQHPNWAERVRPLLFYSRAVAASSAHTEAERAQALRLVGYQSDKRDEDIQLLRELLAPQSPAALQSAAIDAVGRLTDDVAPRQLLAAWPGLGPQHRSHALDLLLSRPRWTTALLAAIEDKRVLPADIDAGHRQRLLALENAELRERATSALAGAIDADRQRVIDEHADVLGMPGDGAQGRELFVKRCSVCHQLRGVGQAVGPDLASLNDNSPRVLLTAMLDPNRAIESRYLQYSALTSDGVTYSGIIASETGSSVTLVGQEGKQQTILRGDLESLKSTGKSLMPEGLEKDLSHQDLADVIAYLRSNGPPRKEFPGNRPELVRANGDGRIALLATNAEIYGPSIVLEDQYKNLGYWSSESDRAAWNVEVERAGEFLVQLNYACADESAGNRYALEAGSKQLVGQIAGTGSWDNYRTLDVGKVSLTTGKQQIVVRPSAPVQNALMDLKSIELKPVRSK
jgi:putative heme-binding domain-containing protein